MAKLWDLSGRQLAQWHSPNNSVYSTVSFSPDGQYLATAGTGGLQIWRIGGLDELLARGCDWLKDYLVTHPEALEKLEVCQNRFKSIEADRNLAKVGEVEGDAIASSASEPVVCDRLSSECGIDYTRLRDLLVAEHWLEADLETTALMLRLSGREPEGWLREQDMDNFPCKDLLLIDNLWVKHSKGRFGFSVQKKIWESLGGKQNAEYRIYRSFSKGVGWSDGSNSWLYYSDLTFNSTAMVGHLPGGLLNWLWSSYMNLKLSLLADRAAADGATPHAFVWWNIIPSIASRLSECNIQRRQGTHAGTVKT
ncbi:MAG: hypothetical protein Fur006_19490 [Coleofasciculaceae cyanobacterium]